MSNTTFAFAAWTLSAFALFNLTAMLAQRALSRWAGQRVGKPLLAAIGGWPYVLRAAWPFMALLPRATRPTSTFRFALGVLKLDLFSTLMQWAFARRTREVRGRATHTIGIAATGTATVPATVAIPSHPFFRAGRSLRATVRHANARWSDDASLDVRGVALRLEGSSKGDRLDLMMNTASRSQFWDTASLMAFLRGQTGGKRALARWIANSPKALRGVLESVVRAPTSYADLTYYAQLTFRFEGDDGVERPCRYRLRPLHSASAHVLSAADRATPWEHERAADEHRTEDYLREELRGRLATGTVTYVLELQVATDDRCADVRLFDASMPWDEHEHPWKPVASVDVTRVLSESATASLKLNVANAPPSLGVFLAGDTSDFNAIAWYRRAVYAHAQRARERLAETFDSPADLSPSPIPENRS